MRDSGALCLPPVGYKVAFKIGSLTLWEPVPPPECLAVGLVGTDGPDPPSVSLVRCPRAALLVESAAVECLLPRESASLWRVGNASGTCVVSPGLNEPQRSILWDLRKPLGVSGPEITAMEAQEAAAAAAEARRHAQQQAEGAPRPECAVATVSEFRRIWWSWNTHATRPLSLWRPLPPPGYVSLGDCAVDGNKTPQRCLSVRDDHDGALAVPLDFDPVFKDSGSRSKRPESKDGTLAIWAPVPPPGYVALGFVATPNHLKPSVEIVRCVRQDLVKKSTLGKSLWSIAGAERKLGSPFLEVYRHDSNCVTFWAHVSNNRGSSSSGGLAAYAGLRRDDSGSFTAPRVDDVVVYELTAPTAHASAQDLVTMAPALRARAHAAATPGRAFLRCAATCSCVYALLWPCEVRPLLPSWLLLLA